MINDNCITHTRISSTIKYIEKQKKLVVIEIMKFCPDCDNIIFPKNGKILYCKACDKEFDLDAKSEDFKIVKKIKHDEKETAPIVVKETLASVKISSQDRKAFEEFFDLGGAEEY